jgi:hypothetical protein
MAVKKFMNTFFKGLQEQSTSGYGSKIVSTPMGPFTWNSELNVWVNMNNGMVMNNISFQESIAMMDYDTSGSDGGSDLGTVYGTIPMVFTPTIYNITSNYGEGSVVNITPSIKVPVGTANFKLKWVGDGSFGGTQSKLYFTRNRNGVVLTLEPWEENTSLPGGPQNIIVNDILTISASSYISSLGDEQYSLYFYNNSGVTLSNSITINVSVPPVIEPILNNTTTRTLTNIIYSGATYLASNNIVGNAPEPIENALGFIFANNNADLSYKLYYTDVVGATFSHFTVDSNLNTPPTATVAINENQGFTLSSGNAFSVGAYLQPAGGSTLSGSGNIVLYNNTAGSTVLVMPYSFIAPPSNTTLSANGSFGGLTATTVGTYFTNAIGGSTNGTQGLYVTYTGSATQPILVGASFTNQQGPIQLDTSNMALNFFGCVSPWPWSTDVGIKTFDEANNRIPIFPGSNFAVRVANSLTGTGSGNILLYDFTNNATLATIPYRYNIP